VKPNYSRSGPGHSTCTWRGEVDDDEVAEAVNAAKSGGQDVRVGKVFVGMRCVGETRFPDFGFFQQGDVCALRGGDARPEGKCNSQDQRTAAGCILPGIRNLKWRSGLSGLATNELLGPEIRAKWARLPMPQLDRHSPPGGTANGRAGGPANGSRTVTCSKSLCGSAG